MVNREMNGFTVFGIFPIKRINLNCNWTFIETKQHKWVFIWQGFTLFLRDIIQDFFQTRYSILQTRCITTLKYQTFYYATVFSSHFTKFKINWAFRWNIRLSRPLNWICKFPTFCRFSRLHGSPVWPCITSSCNNFNTDSLPISSYLSLPEVVQFVWGGHCV